MDKGVVGGFIEIHNIYPRNQIRNYFDRKDPADQKIPTEKRSEE